MSSSQNPIDSGVLLRNRYRGKAVQVRLLGGVRIMSRFHPVTCHDTSPMSRFHSRTIWETCSNMEGPNANANQHLYGCVLQVCKVEIKKGLKKKIPLILLIWNLSGLICSSFRQNQGERMGGGWGRWATVNLYVWTNTASMKEAILQTIWRLDVFKRWDRVQPNKPHLLYPAWDQNRTNQHFWGHRSHPFFPPCLLFLISEANSGITGSIILKEKTYSSLALTSSSFYLKKGKKVVILLGFRRLTDKDIITTLD